MRFIFTYNLTDMFLDFLWKKRKKGDIKDAEPDGKTFVGALPGDHHLSEADFRRFADRVIPMFDAKRTRIGLYSGVSNTPFTVRHIDFFVNNLDAETTFRLLVIASFNRNGYVREKAVKALGSIGNPDAIRFLLVRLADWVIKIRDSAEKAIRNYFKDEYIPVFVKELAFLQRLKLVERVDLTNQFNLISDFILTRDITPEFYATLKGSDSGRLIYVKMKLSTQSLTTEVAKLILEDRNHLIRAELLKHSYQLPVAVRQSIIRSLLKDRSPMVKSGALNEADDSLVELNDSVLGLTSDSASMIRERARFLLRELNYDWRMIYTARINDSIDLIGSILGLAEVGNTDDIKILKKHFESPKPKVKVACLTGIQKLDIDLAYRYALRSINSPSGRLRAISAQILRRRWDSEVMSTTATLFESADAVVQLTILSLHGAVGGWEGLPLIIRATLCQDERLRERGWCFVEIWVKKKLRLFTKPSPDVIAVAASYYDKVSLSSVASGRLWSWKELGYYINQHRS